MAIQTAHWSSWRAPSFKNRKRLEAVLHHAYQTLVSPRTGIISGIFPLYQSPDGHPLQMYHAQVNVVPASSKISWHGGSGAALDRYEAAIAALGEAVERYAASIYDEASDIVWASYSELKERAVCPTTFALPSEADIARYGKYVASFDPDAPMGWAKGWFVPDARPTLVPASFVYGLYRFRSPAERITPGISSGLAAGPDSNWALIRGMCEVIERDAFMISYLNRLPLPEIDLDSVQDPAVLDVLQRIRPWRNCQIRAWNMTTDIRVASILVLLLSPGRTLPAIACASATHVNPALALRKALIEAWQSHSWLAEHAHTRTFASDFHDVILREDHLLLAAQPEYKDSLDWLLAERPGPKLALKSLPDLSADSQEQEVRNVIDAVHQAGLAVVACNLTTPDVAQAGFHVCRAIIPGVQQLAFGPILVKGERLYDVPRRLGYTEVRTTEASLNPVPHPFP